MRHHQHSKSALAIDRMGRIRVQYWFYLAAAVSVCIMGLGLPANAVLAVSIVGRMAVMAASVSIDAELASSFMLMAVFIACIERHLGIHAGAVHHENEDHGPRCMYCLLQDRRIHFALCCGVVAGELLCGYSAGSHEPVGRGRSQHVAGDFR